MHISEAIAIIHALDKNRVDDKFLLFDDMTPAERAAIDLARGNETCNDLQARLTRSVIDELGGDVLIFNRLAWRVAADNVSLVCHSIAEDRELEV